MSATPEERLAVVPRTDRIISSMLRQAGDYQRKAGQATGELKAAYLAGYEEQVELVRQRLARYGVKEISQAVMDRLVEAATKNN